MTSPRTLGVTDTPVPVNPARQRGVKAPAQTPIGAPVERERWGLGVCWAWAGTALLGSLGGPRGGSRRITMTTTPRGRHTALVGHRADLVRGVDA